MSTVEATPAAPLTAEDRLRARALELLKTSTLEVILASDEPLRTGDVGRRVGEHLGLTLSEEELGGLATLARMVMDSDPLFSQSNRQWDLALRLGRAEGDRRKPVERAFEDAADLLGHPAEAQPLATFVAAIYGRDTDYYVKMLERLSETKPQFFKVDGDRIGITRWLLDLSSDDPEEVEIDNFEDTSTLNRFRKLVKKKDNGKTPVEFARNIISQSEEPVDNRSLLFLTWSAFQDLDTETIFSEFYADDELVLEKGPVWVSKASHQSVIDEIRKLAKDPEVATEQLAAVTPEAEEGAPTSQSVKVSDDDLDQVYSYMAGETRTYRVPELCQQALEAFPGSRTYQAVHDSLLNRMREDSRFLWVGWERYRLQGTIPEEVLQLPEGIAFPPEAEYLDDEGQNADRLVDPRDWKFQLDQQITHYDVQDVGDDATSPGAIPASLVSSPPLHHYVAGTRYLRHSDRGFFPTDPQLVQAAVVASDGQKFDIWVNNGLGLVYGLKDWYENSGFPWVGGRFVLEKGEQPDEFRLNYNGETDELMDIPLDQLQSLLQLRAAAVSELMPLTEIVKRILQAVPAEGIPFVNLFARVNVVRRTRRATLAGILSSQRFFQQSPQTPGIWAYDEKRAQKAKKKGAPKRIRDYDDDDDVIEETE